VRLPEIDGAAFELACASTGERWDVEVRTEAGTESRVLYSGTRPEVLLFLRSTGTPAFVVWSARELVDFARRSRESLRRSVDHAAAQIEQSRSTGARYEVPAFDEGARAWLEVRANNETLVLEIHGAWDASEHSASRPLHVGNLDEIVRYLRAPASLPVLVVNHALVTTYTEPLSQPPPSEDEIRAGVRVAPTTDWRHKIEMSSPPVRALVNECGRPALAASLSREDRERALADGRMLLPSTRTFQGDVESAGWSLVRPGGESSDTCIVFPSPVPDGLRSYWDSTWDDVAQVLAAFGLG
jgi:hypothetical protein